MANYSLILDTKFNPFSYQEMLAPVAAATQAHQAIEEEYGDLSAKASVWKNMANEQSDPYAYKMYKGYADDLEARAEDLMRYGLNASSRKGMLDMRTRYNSEILPIEVAYKRRDELIKEQRNARAANPTLRYQRMAKDMSLDEFIKNPSLDYGESYSGALLTQQVAQAAANYAKVLTEEGKLDSLGLPYQYKSRIQHGASPEVILAVINNAALEGHQGAVNFLRGVRDQVLQSSGVAKWADPTTMAEFTSFANQGLYSALGQTEIKNYADNFGMQSALQAQAHRHRMAEQRAAAEAQATAMHRAAKGKMWAFKPGKLIGEKSERSGTFDKYRQYKFYNSKGQLTKGGSKNAKLGSRIADYIYQSNHAKTFRDKLHYAKLAYRAAYGKDINNEVGDSAPYLLQEAKKSQQYQLYTDMRNSGISKRDIYNQNWNVSNADIVATSYAANTGNPSIETLTHSIEPTSGKAMMSDIASELANQNVSMVRVNSKGEIVPGRSSVNLLTLNKGKKGEDTVYITRVSIAPTSPDKTILTLSNGYKVMLTPKQMDQAFGTSISEQIIANSRLYVYGDHNESALGLHNINELMGTATTQWSNPKAEGTGMVDYTYDYGDE